MSRFIQSHLQLAHFYWTNFLQLGDHVVDATCGNGHDSLVLARGVLAHKKGLLTCIDVQRQAIENTKNRLQSALPSFLWENISYHLTCHSHFPSFECLPKLIVYNFGYLPGSDKKVTTRTKTSLQSLQTALSLLRPDGAVSITFYPGHPAGAEEEKELIIFFQALDPKQYRLCYHRWLHSAQAPSLLLIEKITTIN